MHHRSLLQDKLFLIFICQIHVLFYNEYTNCNNCNFVSVCLLIRRTKLCKMHLKRLEKCKGQATNNDYRLPIADLFPITDLLCYILQCVWVEAAILVEAGIASSYESCSPDDRDEINGGEQFKEQQRRWRKHRSTKYFFKNWGILTLRVLGYSRKNSKQRNGDITKSCSKSLQTSSWMQRCLRWT